VNIKKVIYLIIVAVTLFGLMGCSGWTTKVGWVGSSGILLILKTI